MPKNLNFKVNAKDPRLVMRVILGVLLLANMVGAVVVLKPFGGSAEDLRRERQELDRQLSQSQKRVATSRKLVEKVQAAREDGDDFIEEFFMNEPTTSAVILQELTKDAKEAGVQMGQAQWNREPIEGTDTMFMLSMQVGFEGTYQNLTKFVNLVDKSDRFMIIESMQAAAPQQQGGQRINVTLKIDMFVKEVAEAAAQ
jgi:type IV pilus assembly protein PilO